MNDRATAVETGFRAHAAQDFDETTAEHISLGDEFAERANAARTVSDRIIMKDKLRDREAVLTFYEQGFLEFVERRRRKHGKRLPIDLRYLDPTPAVERRYPNRLFKAGCAVGGLALATGALAAFGVASVYTAAAVAILSTATVVAAIACVYLSHERIRFFTQHGRALTLQLEAGLGTIRRYRQMLPKLIGAIEAAGEGIGEDTTVYLRSEMREHYRLRSAGVLSDDDCARSTARILGHFDDPL